MGKMVGGGDDDNRRALFQQRKSLTSTREREKERKTLKPVYQNIKTIIK